MQFGMRVGKLGVNLWIVGRDGKRRVQRLNRGGIAVRVESSVGQCQL